MGAAKIGVPSNTAGSSMDRAIPGPEVSVTVDASTNIFPCMDGHRY